MGHIRKRQLSTVRVLRRLPAVSSSADTRWVAVADCILQSFYHCASTTDLGSWSLDNFHAALQYNANFSEKLTALWRFGELLRLADASPDGFGGYIAMAVRHAGYRSNHALDRCVRAAAMTACQQAGSAALPELLRRAETCRQDSWYYYANVLQAALAIDPENPGVREILDRAVEDPEVTVRERIVFMLEKISSPWVDDVFKRLARDPSDYVRAKVREVRENWVKQQPWYRPPSQGKRRRKVTKDRSVAAPSARKLKALPHFACVAFAGRAAQHLVRHFMAWPEAPAMYFGSLHRVAEAAMNLAAGRGEAYFDPNLEDDVTAAYRQCHGSQSGRLDRRGL